jgi:phosphate acetyltransferase
MARSTQVFFLAPVARECGLTSIALGLVQALRRDRVAVGYAKPIAQPPDRGQEDNSAQFARQIFNLEVPEPMPFAEAERRVRQGEIDALLEDLVASLQTVCHGCDALVVEGLIPDTGLQIASRLNAAMARAFSASLVPVLSRDCHDETTLAAIVGLTLQQFAESQEPPPLAGVAVNHLNPGAAPPLPAKLHGTAGDLPVLCDIPYEPKLRALRVKDVRDALDLEVLNEGAIASKRVLRVSIAGRGVEGVIEVLGPGTLVVTTGERSDIVLASGLAYLQGMPLAGILLTCGTRLSPQVESLLRGPDLASLPILATTQNTFDTGAALAALSHHVRADDIERMQQAVSHAAENIATAPLQARIGHPGQLRMPPPAFRHRLVQLAREGNRRIVLPEGDEPRTVQAAITCHQKGIARCLLLGEPDRIRHVAEVQGLALPDTIEMVNPALVRLRYVDRMVEMRRSKGLTAAQAEQQLEDNVVLGTMMLACDEVDGLVSGAVHTTANTIRPALQLIRTAPGVSIVSSIFFMLLPDDVVVYGDCAVNPDPSAEELADIALQSAASAQAFGIEPRVAMISYSTGSSGGGADVDKVCRALEIARSKAPDLLIDGPLQYDAASVESVARQKAPGSKVAGRATVFIFPDLNTGNTTYKAVQRSAHVVSIGPMLQGLRKPVNDLSRGALVEDIIYTIALTAIQAGQTAALSEPPTEPLQQVAD